MFSHLESMYSSIPSEQQLGAGVSNVSGIVRIAATAVVLLGIAVSLIFLALSLVQLATSAGDPKSVEKARTAISWSVIGIVVSAAAYTLVGLIIKILGV